MLVANASEAAVIEGVTVYPVRRIEHTFALLWSHGTSPEPVTTDVDALFADAELHVADFSDVRGHRGGPPDRARGQRG